MSPDHTPAQAKHEITTEQDGSMRVETIASQREEDDSHVVGVARLRNAIEKELRKQAAKIATKLAEKAAGGDSNSTKLLLLILKENAQPAQLKYRRGPSEAERLAAEPPWVEPPDDPSEESDDDPGN